MIPEPGDANREITVTETFHLQTDDELSEKELKKIEADDQAIQTILLSLSEDIYAAVDKKIARNLKFLNNLQPEWSRHVTIVHQTKDLNTTDYTQLSYNCNEYGTRINGKIIQAKLLNTNQQQSENFIEPKEQAVAQPDMNMGQDGQMKMVGGNGGNQFRQYAGQNARNPAGGVGHYARNCTFRPRRRDVAYLQTQLLIAQKEEAGIQLQAEEYDLMAAAVDLDEIEKVNANCILMANLQQASTSGTQTDSAPVYDTDGSAEVHENCDDNEIFNIFTQEEQYTELLEPIPKSHQVPQNDNDVIFEDTSVEQGGEIVE
nr:hypothetical protein [Tanacetum cinerariifolium]